MKILNNFIAIALFIFLSTKGAKTMEDHDCAQCRGTLGASIHGSTGKWLDQDVPHRDWTCLEVEDLGAASELCQMCERETIRYVHRMEHEEYETLDVGCVCAGHMEEDELAAKLRDKDLRSRAQRRDKWLDLGWKTSKNGNPFLKTRTNKSDPNPHVVAITKSKFGQFSANVDGTYLNTWHASTDQAKLAAFDHLWPARRGG